jgi:UDP:flavonoid glycosyltransferase YjiC (YdhE family)
MRKRHVAIIVESVYGHIVPTLGIASELMKREYRVSYAVKTQFRSRINDFGAEAVTYRPLENKIKLFKKIHADRGINGTSVSESSRLWDRLRLEEMRSTLAQLEEHYRRDKPDIVIYDIMNPAGKALAKALGIACIEHSPLLIEAREAARVYDENLVLVSIPKFFQLGADNLDDRFQFVGFIQNDRKRFFVPWTLRDQKRRSILIYATTGLLAQTDFFKMAITALEGFDRQIVLSVGDRTALDPLLPLPRNCVLNRTSANVEILETADLVLGQAGTGSTLEALYWGVPQLLIPPPLPVFEDCASRVAQLGLGVVLKESEATSARVRNMAAALLEDKPTQNRLRDVSSVMQSSSGAVMAADLIENSLLH